MIIAIMEAVDVKVVVSRLKNPQKISVFIRNCQDLPKLKSYIINAGIVLLFLIVLCFFIIILLLTD